MQLLNKSTIESLLLEHLANAGYTLAKVFGIKNGLCANNSHLRCWEILLFLYSLAFGGATLVALKQNDNNERKMEV